MIHGGKSRRSLAWFVRSSANKQPPSITTCSSSMDPCFFRGKGRKLFSNSFSKKDDGSGLQFHFSMNHPFFFLPRVEKKVATTKERLRLKDSMRIKMKAGKARPDIQVSNNRTVELAICAPLQKLKKRAVEHGLPKSKLSFSIPS